MGNMLNKTIPKIFFISSKWRNKEKVEKLTKELRNLRFEVISFLEYPINKDVIKKDPEEEMRKWEAMTDWEGNERVKQIAQEDKKSINRTNTLILYIFGTVPKKVGLGRCENKGFLG
ncbi:hypothetical protein CO121_01750 [bacterium (Candidatus Gribaldobacteria) CG_4_9_14_3_um_filter_36_15]|uniref:Uncharacterized protein n=2 Tax=Candidatus Gribaldobacteria TaxID=2798536 RepID=A0A2M7VKL5_9BACT|nr:MAG: hypothetical protein COX73_01285 [bacterium (Candidatus Gribaldobacteria) CG_4_10_14_0_2_um_filter_36_18]PJB09115.1 MAG: hypothetical protein CO121_01750 [bacterium (Candidatus Gribaldobacteria) CG_4_9_14_3_um_filter_36_15]